MADKNGRTVALGQKSPNRINPEHDVTLAPAALLNATEEIELLLPIALPMFRSTVFEAGDKHKIKLFCMCFECLQNLRICQFSSQKATP